MPGVYLCVIIVRVHVFVLSVLPVFATLPRLPVLLQFHALLRAFLQLWTKEGNQITDNRSV